MNITLPGPVVRTLNDVDRDCLIRCSDESLLLQACRSRSTKVALETGPIGPVSNANLCNDCRNLMLWNTIHEYRLKRKLQALRVCCINHVKGCEWTGELREMQQHLQIACDKDLMSS